MPTIPDTVIRIRQQICKRQNCNMQAQLNYSDPCAQCPNGHWGKFTTLGCPDTRKDIHNPRHTPIFLRGPGDIFSKVIFKITGQVPGPNCSCNAKKVQMNAWGWFGCWKNRKIITEWLIQEAKKRGHEIADGEVLGLVKAAFKELRQEKKGKGSDPQ